MEVEVTYEEFLKYYPPLQTDFSKAFSKNGAASSEQKYTYRPPFLILHDEIFEPSMISTNTLLNIYEMLQNQDLQLRHSSFTMIDSAFYVTKIQENYFEMKDGTDRGFIFLGPFEPKKLIPAAAIGNFNQNKLKFGKRLISLSESLEELQAKLARG